MRVREEFKKWAFGENLSFQAPVQYKSECTFLISLKSFRPRIHSMQALTRWSTSCETTCPNLSRLCSISSLRNPTVESQCFIFLSVKIYAWRVLMVLCWTLGFFFSFYLKVCKRTSCALRPAAWRADKRHRHGAYAKRHQLHHQYTGTRLWSSDSCLTYSNKGVFILRLLNPTEWLTPSHVTIKKKFYMNEKGYLFTNIYSYFWCMYALFHEICSTVRFESVTTACMWGGLYVRRSGKTSDELSGKWSGHHFIRFITLHT